MAGLLSCGGPAGEGGDASPVRSGSADWELISASPSAPLPQPRDDVFGLEEFKVRTLSIFGSVFDSSGFLQDDYFTFEANKADLAPIPMAMEGGLTLTNKAGSSVANLDNTDNFQKSYFPHAVSADPGSVKPSSSPLEVIKNDEAVANVAFERRSAPNNISIESGVAVTKRLSQGDSVAESCYASDPTTLYTNSRFPSQLDAPWYDTQSGVGRIQLLCYDRRSKCVDEGGPAVAARDSETIGSTLSKGMNVDATELSRSNEGGKSFVCDSWIGRQLSLWQSQLARSNSVWTLALAAATMGLLIVGRGWQRLQAQNQKLRLQLLAKDKKMAQLMCQVVHMNESLSQSRAAPVIQVDNSLNAPKIANEI